MLFLYDYFSILWNIHLTYARSCSCRHSLSWVVFYAVVRSWACLSVPIIGAGTREIWKFWEGLGRRLGKFWCPLVESIDRLDVVTCGVTRWLGRGCRAAWLGVGCSGQLLVKGRKWTSLSYWVCVADCQPQFTCFGVSEDLGACVMVSTGRWGLCAFCWWC